MTAKHTQECILLLLLLSICQFAFAQVGDSCTVRSTNSPGICRKSSDCPSVEEQAKNGIRPTLCGFYQLTVPIVCCAKNTFSAQPNDNSFVDRESSDSFVYPSDSDNESNRPPPKRTRLTKSEQKCQEYSKMVTGVVQAIPLVTNTEAISINIVKCDYNGVALIVGGHPALAGEFPFMAAIGFDVGTTAWKCGGTLISDEYVLTAAHCTFSIDGGAPTVVRLGDLDLTRSDDGSVHADYRVKNITVHPNYRYPQKYNDIALIQLATKVKFTKYIRPACLYTKSNVEQSQAIATGWGHTEFGAAEMSSKLMKVALNVYNNDQCSRTYQPDKRLPQGIVSTMLCAGELKGDKDTCQGDSGGPLLITKKGNQCKFYIIGVTSFGKSCAQENTPAVYTRVSDYVSWIEKTIW